MKTIIKRVCVWPLALALIVSLLPMSAFAATVEAKLTCTTTEHVHNEDCYEIQTVRPLICGMTAEGHTHTDDCYAWSYGTELVCDHAAAQHTHSEELGCYATTDLQCPKEEHTHSGACQKTCDAAEHQHDDSCGEDCTVPEHTHSGACQMTCSLEEHTHTDACTTSKKLICTQSDLPEEKHTQECYAKVRGQLLCTLEEVPAHEHTEECYGEAEEQKVLICELEAHTHTAACFENKAVVDGQATEKTLQEALKEVLNSGKDDEITLILNGQVLDYQYGTGNHAGLDADGNERADVAILVNGGQTLNIEDAIGGGGISGESGGNNLRLIMVTNGTVNLKGGTLSGGKAYGGGAVYVRGEDSQLNMSGGAISGNQAVTNGGGVLVENNGQFTMSGGSIDGNTANENGGGVYVGNNGKFEMTGGAISGNSTDTTKRDDKDEPIGQGGGVAVGPGGSFAMSGGAISGNTAGEGGGVFVDRDKVNGSGPYTSGEFEMTGGAIDGNTAIIGEGGGVYLKGEGTITGGAITNNATYTYEDLGGGGIYIESDGVLTLKNAIITSNTANGMGGGIAACVHGKTYVYALEGAVITGNTALGQGHTQGHEVTEGVYNGSFIDGYTYWASAKDILKDMGQDIFAAGDSFHASFSNPDVAANAQGTAGIVVSNNLPGASGGTANWNGYTYCYVTDEKGDPVKDSNGNYLFELTEVTEDNNGVVYGNRLVFLTSKPDQESVQKAIQAMQGGVIIAGNLSANSHGGGIANNGVLTIGKGPMNGTNSKPSETELTKNLESNDDSVSIANKTFTFEMKDAEGNLVEGGSVTNDESGKAVFNFPPEYFNNVEFGADEFEKEFVFFVSEVNDGQENVTYDGTQYKVVIKITRTVEEVKLGSGTVTMETLSIGEPEILVEVVGEDGAVSYVKAENGIVFNNTYTKPTDPDPTPTPSTDPDPDPTPSTDPDPDPSSKPGDEDPSNTTTPKDPDDPEVPLDDPEVPLDEPDLPLAELPAEPEKAEELELEDPDVPLSDIPQTGDTPLGWYGASILSALGLMVMTLLGRKKGKES